MKANGFLDDCEFGKSKVFIRSPQTLFKLEELRTTKIPYIALVIQRVSLFSYRFFSS